MSTLLTEVEVKSNWHEHHSTPMVFRCMNSNCVNVKSYVKFGMVTHMGRRMFLGGQPRNCTCTNASCSLSATAEFLVSYNGINQSHSLSDFKSKSEDHQLT